MNGKDIELSRRRVLGGVATIGAASAAAGAGTFALFSDTETSSNSVSAGELNLQVDTAEDGSVISINVEDAIPDTTEGYIVFSLENTGTINGSSLEVSIANINDQNGTPDVSTEPDDVDIEGEGGLSEILEVGIHLEASEPGDGTGTHEGDFTPTGTTLVDDGTTLRNAADEGPHSPPSDGTPDGSLATDPDTTKHLVFEYAMPDTDDNSVQGDTVSFDLEITLHQ